MVFNSLEFAVFFSLVFSGYWLINSRSGWQNALLLLANYAFYSWWDWRFALILAGVTTVSFAAGRLIAGGGSRSVRKTWLVVGIVLISSSLLVLKYYNFFVESINSSAKFLGHEFQLDLIRLLLPIGLSYYVFSTIGYIVDVYREERDAEKNPLTFFAYVSFFPHLLSGPIGQSTRLLPQFSQPRRLTLNTAKSAAGDIVFGLFKKVVVADSLGKNVNYIFANHGDLPGSLLFLGLVMFSFQIYADFSGYSQMAQGFARLLGFELMENFREPYFSRSVGEFWRRWHRSLSAWLKEYIYLPLGGRGSSRFVHARNILIVFTFSGLWHGASWNFVIWGMLNGIYLLPAVLLPQFFSRHGAAVAEGRWLPSFKETAQILLTFFLITFSRVFFRSPDLTSAIAYLDRLFSASLFVSPDFDLSCFYWVGALLALEWMRRDAAPKLEFRRWHLVPRFAAYIGIIAAIAASFGTQPSRDYLYFKF